MRDLYCVQTHLHEPVTWAQGWLKSMRNCTAGRLATGRSTEGAAVQPVLSQPPHAPSRVHAGEAGRRLLMQNPHQVPGGCQRCLCPGLLSFRQGAACSIESDTIQCLCAAVPFLIFDCASDCKGVCETAHHKALDHICCHAVISMGSQQCTRKSLCIVRICKICKRCV